MIETVIIIRNKKDITDYVNDPILFVSPKNDLSLDKLKKRLHDYLKDYKQFSFIQSTGHIVAAIDKKNQLLVSLPINELDEESQDLKTYLLDKSKEHYYSKDKEIYDQIIKVSESIPHVEPVQPFIVGGALFSALKSAPDFTQDDAPNIAATITAMLGSITIICDGFIQNDDPNIYQFVDNKLTIVATVTGLDKI